MCGRWKMKFFRQGSEPRGGTLVLFRGTSPVLREEDLAVSTNLFSS